MSTQYDFSTLYTMLPHHLIKDKPIDLIERTFSREQALYSACPVKTLDLELNFIDKL